MVTAAAIGSTGARPAPVRPRAAAPEAEQPVETGRSLVALMPVERADRAIPDHRRSFAPLIAHLAAIAADAPQTRRRRREDPLVASAAYRAAATLAGAVGVSLARSL
jgi:hypothetical protein